jgi:hypothetical protein
MPSTEKPLRPRVIVAQSNLSVNDVVEQVRASSPQACKDALEGWQDMMLLQVLGPAWAPRQVAEAPWHCKSCGSRLGFKRRGSRSRKVKTSLGLICFQLRQVTCVSCQSTSSPFPDLLRLQPRTRVSTELSRKVVDAATRVSYRQSSELCQVMTGQALSPNSIHAKVQEYALSQMELPLAFSQPQPAVAAEESTRGGSAGLEEAPPSLAPVKIPLLLLDSTKVRAGKKKTGLDLNVAVAVYGHEQHGKRAVLHKTVVAFGTGSWASLKDDLRRVEPMLILIDGDRGLVHLVQELYPGVPVQRCLWHISYTLGYFLWRYKMPKQQRDEWLRRLGSALFNVSTSTEGLETLHMLAHQLDQDGYENVATMLETAAQTAFTYLDVVNPLPGGRHGRCAPVATGYIERQMREINRRVDNGTRWTEQGIARLLRLAVLRRLDPDHWDRLWLQPA